MAWARRLLWRAAAFGCSTPLAATRSITACERASAAVAAFLSPAWIAFWTVLIALRAAVRRLRLRLRRVIAWRARLRADLILAMEFRVESGGKRGRILA